MPKNSKTLHKEFLKKLKVLDEIRKNFESASNSRIISSNDIIQAYSGLYLDTFTEFESLIEILFFGILNGSIKLNNPDIKRKITINPRNEIESIVIGEKRSYLDWLPYSDFTIPRAKLYFIDGKPFTLLSEDQKNKLKNYHKIRNAIAHKSKKATKEFNDVIAGLTLLPIEQTPQGYLRNIPNRATGKTQLEIISDELKSIAFTLCS